LCVTCYANPSIRAKAPEVVKKPSKRAARSRERPLPTPTTIPPGPLKAAVIAARAKAGQQLWHPLDAKE